MAVRDESLLLGMWTLV